MFKKITKSLGGNSARKEFKEILVLVDQINELESDFEKLNDSDLNKKTSFFRKELASGKTLGDILPQAFAAIREASKRTLGLRHYDVQLIGGIVMHQGKIAEMKTGEGKTLAATLPLYLNALIGKGVHLVTVNDYLARRDARWMAPIYSMLGLSVGVLQMASKTENGRNGFLVDLEKRSNNEGQDQLVTVSKSDAYKADITYGTNNEFGFDYLRDNLARRLEDRAQRGHHYTIVDEIDNILIDEARTPLIISGAASEDIAWHEKMAVVVKQLETEDYDYSEKDRSIALTEVGEVHVEELIGTSLKDPARPEDITPEQARLLGYLEQALKAKLLFKKNKDYIIQGGQVIIVDEFTGRLMPGRRWSEGLHQAVEAKEGVRVQPENVTQATITLQNYFRMYEKLAGMTGTALTEEEEFLTIYDLEVIPIPTNLDFVASLDNTDLDTHQNKDEEGYTYTYYSFKDDSEAKEAFWKRKDYPDVIYQNREAKLRAITFEIIRFHLLGRPQLIGTTSIEHSEELSSRLNREKIRGVLQIELYKYLWREKFNIRDLERAIPELAFLNEPLEQINSSTLRSEAQKAGIESISLGNPDNLIKILETLYFKSDFQQKLENLLNSGIKSQVLNALKHTEESQIIAKAGEFGAVTIATNMAGRGVDIKLGGELDEDTLADISRVLKANSIDPYKKSFKEIEIALKKMSLEQMGIYETSVNAFFKYMENMRRVREVGGLHVVGSERHEARRIDNQLRGRAARQGDPGSSRFYLSLEDDLMRLFGGQRAENLMKVFNIDPALPIESGMIGKMVEQAQERVEGSNFDIRKHLLEYDDVLNDQREKIYGERDKALTKEDIKDDIWEMVITELSKRIPVYFDNPPEFWKLFAFLDEIQPGIINSDFGIFFPSFTYQTIIDWLRKKVQPQNKQNLKAAFEEAAVSALNAEKIFLSENISDLLDRTEQNYKETISERLNDVEIYLENIQDSDSSTKDIKSFRDELQNYSHVKVHITNAQFSELLEGSKDTIDDLLSQIESTIFSIFLKRINFALVKRLGNLNIQNPSDIDNGDWRSVRNYYQDEIQRVFNTRINDISQGKGEISNNIENSLEQFSGSELNDEILLKALINISTGSRIAINPNNHQRVQRKVRIMSFVFSAADLSKNENPEILTQEILEHFKHSSEFQKYFFGKIEFERISASNISLGQLNKSILEKVESNSGLSFDSSSMKIPINNLNEDQKEGIIIVLANEIQNTLYRQNFLNNINHLWVEHLTQMEALRVSIRMEAYAQRDPLIQYKNQSTDLFRELLESIRLGVVSQIFRLQPQVQSKQPVKTVQNQLKSEQKDKIQSEQPKNKKRRRRR